MKFTTDEGRILLDHARRAIALRCGRANQPEIAEQSAAFQQRGATFVTLKKKGQLRGCIGNLEPVGRSGMVYAKML